MTNNKRIACPVDLIMIDENKARLTASFVFILTLVYSFTNFLAIPVLLMADFFVRGFNFSNYSPLNIIANRLSLLFSIKPKLIDQAPKRFSAKIGLLFCLSIVAFSAFDFGTVSLVIAIVLATFALLESSLGVCAGCHVYSLYSKISVRRKSFVS